MSNQIEKVITEFTKRAEAERTGINNVSFVQGMVEIMPFADASFDMVMSRLAFHHFQDPEIVFAEMVRVLKSGGKLVIVYESKRRSTAVYSGRNRA